MRRDLECLALERGDVQIEQVAALSEGVRRRIPRRQTDALDAFRRWDGVDVREEVVERCGGIKVKIRHGVKGLLRLLPLGLLLVLELVEPVKERETGADAMGDVNSRSGGPDQLSYPEHMYPGLFLGIWVLDEDELRVGPDAGDICELDVVADPLPIEFKVEASVLEGSGELDDGLPDILDLFCGGDLRPVSIANSKSANSGISDVP